MSSALFVLVTMMGAGMEARSGCGMAPGALVVGSAGKRRVDFTKHVGAALVVATHDNAVGIKEVGDGGTFAEEFRIGSDVEGVSVSAVAQNDLANPLTGVNGNGAFLNDDFIVVDRACDFASHRFDKRKISFSALGGRSSDGDKNSRAGVDGCAQIIGKSEALSAMTVQKFRKKIFMNGDLPVFERRKFALIVVDQYDVMTQIGEAGARDQSHVSGTNHSNPHVSNSLNGMNLETACF